MLSSSDDMLNVHVVTEDIMSSMITRVHVVTEDIMSSMMTRTTV